MSMEQTANLAEVIGGLAPSLGLISVILTAHGSYYYSYRNDRTESEMPVSAVSRIKPYA